LSDGLDEGESQESAAKASMSDRIIWSVAHLAMRDI
jgi:hypothetical protein